MTNNYPIDCLLDNLINMTEPFDRSNRRSVETDGR